MSLARKRSESPAVRKTRAILSILKRGQSRESWEREGAVSSRDWDDLALRAAIFGLAPQVYRRVREWEVNLPPVCAAKLRHFYQANFERNRRILGMLDEVLEACRTARIEILVLKGVHLAEAIYPDSALRPMNDIDLLVCPPHLGRLEKVLVRLGYEGRYKSADLGPRIIKHVSTFRRPGAPRAVLSPYLFPSEDPIIEPHQSLEESWFGLRVDISSGFWERGVERRLGRQNCRVLSNEDLLLHLCTHFCFHTLAGQMSLVQLTDLMWLLDQERFDWEALLDRVERSRAGGFVLPPLRLVRETLGAQVPPDVEDRIRRSLSRELWRNTQRFDLAYVLNLTQQKPLRNWSQRILRGIQDRFEACRWSDRWPVRLRIWGTAFTFWRSDTWRLPWKA